MRCLCRGLAFVGTLVALLTVTGLAAAQPNSGSPSVTDEFVMGEYARTMNLLIEIQRSMQLILQRRTVRFHVDLPGALISSGSSKEITPSALYAVLTRQPNNIVAPLFTQLLQQVQTRQPLSSFFASGCNVTGWDDWGAQALNPAPFVPSAAWKKLSKRLDVGVRIQIEPCPVVVHESQRLNSPGAVRPTDTNSIAITSEASKRFYTGLADAFKVGPDALIDMMIGQAYLFEDAEDSAIDTSRYLSSATRRAFDQAWRVLMPHFIRTEAVELVFNRENLQGYRFSTDRRGWFNAREDGAQLYVSPTLVRAALVPCASTMSFIPALLYQLEKEDLKKYREGRMSRNDFLFVVRRTDKSLAKIDQCVLNQLGFVFAHELAHSRLLITTEERADCVARAVQRQQAWPSRGVMRSLIFNVALSDEASLLGAVDKNLGELQCRARIDREDFSMDPDTLEAAISACLARPRRCID